MCVVVGRGSCGSYSVCGEANNVPEEGFTMGTLWKKETMLMP